MSPFGRPARNVKLASAPLRSVTIRPTV